MRRRRWALIAAVGVAMTLVAACSADRGARDDGHVAVSSAPIGTESAPPSPTLSLQPVPRETLAPEGFGMHMNRVDDQFWPDVPIGAVRIWNPDSVWGRLERSRGSWTFADLDQRVAQAEARDAAVLLVLSHPPAWAASRPDLRAYGGSPSPPTDLQAWRTYVRTVATRYAGRIEAYEIWNEPNLPQFYVGTPERLAELTAAASEEVRAADPTALVVSSGLSARTPGSVPFFQGFVADLPTEAVDVVGIHIYPYPGDGPESMLDLAAQFRSLADAAGFAGKPMWNTEIGYGRTPTAIIAGPSAASLILRTYLVLPAHGLDRNYWYAYDNIEFVGLQLVEADATTETAAAAAYAEAQRWLAGASIAGCVDLGESLWECELNRGGVSVVIRWKLGAPTDHAVPPGATVQYPFTGSPSPVTPGTSIRLGELPVLFSPVEIAELDE